MKSPNVALVSSPSIQLGVLSAVLEKHAIEHTTHPLYLAFMAWIARSTAKDKVPIPLHD